MYRACIHCCADLGHNEIIEPFPIGRRLAFDSAKGRLWVICPSCGRWNLTPLEERWEAVEDCERRFRGMRLRAQTSNIGLARLSEGLELVRFGSPLRPEFAAWRYGREFTRRRTRFALRATAVGLAVGEVAVAGLYATSFVALPHLAWFLYQLGRDGIRLPSVAELPRGPGRAWTVDCSQTVLLPGADGWRLSVKHHFGRAELAGAEAQRVLTHLLTRVNRSGGSDGLVADAVKQVEVTSTEAFIRQLAEESERSWEVDSARRREYDAELDTRLLRFDNHHVPPPIVRAGLGRLPAPRRLALEMALHEVSERRAIEGELSALEAAWKEAEDIAGIADDLLLPASAQAFLERHRQRAGDSMHRD
jgi:hypothetical protein